MKKGSAHDGWLKPKAAPTSGLRLPRRFVSQPLGTEADDTASTIHEPSREQDRRHQSKSGSVLSPSEYALRIREHPETPKQDMARYRASERRVDQRIEHD
jgi:hypothetical protein